MEMAEGMVKKEALLRGLTIPALILVACLVRFDTQTALLFSAVREEATFTKLSCLPTLAYVALVAAGYNLVQLSRCFVHIRWEGTRTSSSSTNLLWACFLLDQAVVYAFFAANSAGAAGSLVAVTGADSLLWAKVCDKFTRFCLQIGGSLLCGLLASLLMALTASVSAFNLFHLYSPKRFLLLKARS